MTDIDVQHFSNKVSTLVKWKIANFTAQAPKETKAILQSSPFYLYKSRLSFYLRFDSISSKDEHKDCCALYLMPENLDNEKAVNLRWKFWIKNEDEQKIGNKNMLNYKFEKENSGRGYSNYIEHSKLYPPESEFIKNGVVIICCQIIRHTGQTDFKSIQLNDTEVLKTFYETTKSEDRKRQMKIELKNNKKLKVEKSLLSLCSPVLAQMLRNENYEETQNNVMKMDDFESEVIEALIEFMHLGYVTQENLKYVDDLLKLSDIYSIKKLKEECCQILIKTINKDTIYSLFVASVTYDCLKLKESILNYLSRDDSDANLDNFINKDNVFFLLKTCFTNDCPELKEKVLIYVGRDDSEVSFKNIMKTKEWKKFTMENEVAGDEIVDAVFAKIQWFKTNGNQAEPSTSTS